MLDSNLIVAFAAIYAFYLGPDADGLDRLQNHTQPVMHANSSMKPLSRPNPDTTVLWPHFFAFDSDLSQKVQDWQIKQSMKLTPRLIQPRSRSSN